MSPERSRQQARALGFSALVVLGLHLTVLGGLAPETIPAGSGPRPALTLIRPPSVAPGSPEPALAPSEASREPLSPTALTEPETTPAQPLAGTESDPAPNPVEGSPGDDTSYLPRRLLSLGPQPRQRIELPLADGLPAGSRVSAELTLFIDETGSVRRVRFDRGDLPVWLEDAVRQSFLQAHFQPGQRNDQAVRAQMRIEVEFESMELLPPQPIQADQTPASTRR